MKDQYFSGFFDADGTVQIKRNNKKWFELVCLVYNTNREVLELFQNEFGGKIYLAHHYPERGWKDCWRWTVAARKAERFIKRVAPYLVVKRERALLGIKFESLVVGDKRVRANFIKNGESRKTKRLKNNTRYTKAQLQQTLRKSSVTIERYVKKGYIKKLENDKEKIYLEMKHLNKRGQEILSN